MKKPEIFKYTYTYDSLCYIIKYNGIMINGLCRIPELAKNPTDLNWLEYHREQAKEKLVQILKEKKLWQTKKVAPTTLKK